MKFFSALNEARHKIVVEMLKSGKRRFFPFRIHNSNNFLYIHFTHPYAACLNCNYSFLLACFFFSFHYRLHTLCTLTTKCQQHNFSKVTTCCCLFHTTISSVKLKLQKRKKNKEKTSLVIYIWGKTTNFLSFRSIFSRREHCEIIQKFIECPNAHMCRCLNMQKHVMPIVLLLKFGFFFFFVGF